MCTKEQEHVITLLRASKLLRTTGFDADKETLIQGIVKLNEECEQRLIKLAEVGECTSEDISTKCAWKAHCENEKLSLNNAGQLLKALYISPETKALHDKDRFLILDTLMMQYGMSGAKPNPV